MADNLTLPATGATVAADDVAGVIYQRVKLTLGADGVSDGDVSSANPMPVTMGAMFAEDSVHTSGDMGLVMLGIRSDSDASTAANGDYTVLKLDEEGRVKVASKPASYAATVGNMAANGQTVVVNAERFSNLMIHCAGTFSTVNVTFEGSLNSTNGTDGNWFAVQAIRSNANTIETTTGNLSAAPAYAWELSVNALKFFRVRATAWTSGTQVWTMIPGTYATEPIPGAQVSATQPVSGTVTTTLSAGTNAIGDFGIQARANATGAATIHHMISAATTNAAIVKASAGRVLGYCLSNTTATWQFVKLHNIATLPTAGAGIATTIGIPPNGKAECDIAQGIGFTTGIGRTIVTGSPDADATATTVGAVVGDIFFA